MSTNSFHDSLKLDARNWPVNHKRVDVHACPTTPAPTDEPVIIGGYVSPPVPITPTNNSDTTDIFDPDGTMGLENALGAIIGEEENDHSMSL